MLLPLFGQPAAPAKEKYPLTPDHERKTGVPVGTVTKYTLTSKIFPGTVRDYWVYVPAQYSAEKPAAVMVYQDGGGMVTETGRWRAPIVMDNLIAIGAMPVTIGVFVNPGVLPPKDAATQQGRYNRSYEYDGLGDRYARFLDEELLAEVRKQYNLSKSPEDYGLMGSSSGAIAAFTAAWNRPDKFRRVMSFIGSYTNLRGGNIYPGLIRKTEPKPLRIFLQDGSRDQNIYSGNWYLANIDMANALEYAGYDYTWVEGDEGHNGVHGSSILPYALRWLWREYGKPIQNTGKTGERFYVKEIAGSSQWELVSEGHGFTEGPAVDKQGNVFFTDVRKSTIHRIGLDGKVTLWKENTYATNGLMFGPDGRLYGCQNGRKRVVAWTLDAAGKETAEQVIAEDVNSNDLAVTAKNEVYFTDPSNKRVWFVNAKGEKRVVNEGLEFPNGVLLSPDQSLLLVADMRNKWVWSFQIAADGSLENGLPFYRLETPDENSQSSADGMTVDTDGHLYVATRLGVQICDQPGRVVGILNKPSEAWLANVVFGGADLQTLYATAGDKVWKRRLQRKGTTSWQLAKPPQPRL